jgi:hypothetical protein
MSNVVPVVKRNGSGGMGGKDSREGDEDQNRYGRARLKNVLGLQLLEPSLHGSFHVSLT